MQKAILTSALMGAFLSAPASAVELTGNAGIVSEYLFRGVPQTDGKAAAQGGLDAAWQSGLYLGTWASSVRSGDAFDGTDFIEGTNGLELDLYGGWGGESGDFSYGIGGTYYTYTDQFDDDYYELNLSGGWKWFTLDVAFGKYDNFDGPRQDYTFTSLTGDYNGFYATVGNFSQDFDGAYLEVGYGNTLTVAGEDLFDYTLSYVHSDADLLGNTGNTLIFGIVKQFKISGN